MVSALTKVFVVLLVVISIAFTSFTVSMVAQTTNWKDTAEKYKEHARIADTNLRHEIAANAATLATARDTVLEHLESIHQLEKGLGECRGRTAELQSDLAGTAAEKSTMAAMNTGLVDQLQASNAARAEYRKQRDELERQNIDFQQRNIDLNDRVNELTTGITVLLEQKRQYEQQMHILRTENEKLAGQARRLSSGMTLETPEGAAITDVVALSPVATSAIWGKVLEVSGDLVTITVGSADGVKKDMVFVIHRGDRYVGDLKISLVDPNQSAGRIIRSAVTPEQGDEVTDALRLSESRG